MVKKQPCKGQSTVALGNSVSVKSRLREAVLEGVVLVKEQDVSDGGVGFSCRFLSGVWTTPSPTTSPRAWSAAPSPTLWRRSAWPCAWPMRWTSAWAWRWATGSPTMTAAPPTPSSGQSSSLVGGRCRDSVWTCRCEGPGAESATCSQGVLVGLHHLCNLIPGSSRGHALSLFSPRCCLFSRK